MNNDRFPRSLRESDGHSYGNIKIEDSETPHSFTRTLIGPIVVMLVLTIVLLCYAVAPDTTAPDCHTDTECESLVPQPK